MNTDRLYTRRAILKVGAAGAAGAAVLAACGSSATPSPTAATPTGAGHTGAGPTIVPSAAGYTKPPSNTTGTITISNWGDPPDLATYKNVEGRFKAKYPNVTVVDNFTPITTWPDYINKLLAEIAAGNAPDVINIAIEGVRQGLSHQLFTPLSDYVATDPEAQSILANVDAPLLTGFNYKNQLYLLPNTWNTMLIYYNTKMFAAAGINRPSDFWTWDDFLRIAQKLTTGSGSSKVYGFAIPYFGFGLSPWWFSNSTAPLNADWTASNLTDPKMIEAATWLRDLVTVHGVSPQPKGTDPYSLFPAGKVAMTGAGHWEVGPFKTSGFQDYDVLPWPQKTARKTVYGVSGFAIYSGSKSKDLAWEYCKELAGPQTQNDWVLEGAANPAMRTAAETPQFLSFPTHANLFYDAVDYALPVNAPTVYSTLDPAVMAAMDSIFSSAMSPADALATAGKLVADAFASAT